MFCNKCGSMLNPGDTVCTKCGSPVVGADTNTAAPVNQQPVTPPPASQQNFNQQQTTPPPANQQNFQQQGYQQAYQPQPNFPRPIRTPNPAFSFKFDKSAMIGSSAWRTNLGWILTIVSVFCIISNLFMGMLAMGDMGSDDSTINFSIIQIPAFFGESKFLNAGYHVFAVFVWIFTIVSLLITVLVALKLLMNDSKSAFTLLFYDYCGIVLAKLFAIIAICIVDRGNYKYVVAPAYSMFITGIIAIAFLIFILFNAKKNGISIVPFATSAPINQVPYQNPVQPNMYQNVNQGSNQNVNQ